MRVRARIQRLRRRCLGPLWATALGAVIYAPQAIAAGAGSFDTSFGAGGTATVTVGASAAASAVAVQPDGRVVTGGAATVNGHLVILSTRMTTVGALDPTYGVGGIVTVPINGDSAVYSGAGIALQADGKIVLAGEARDAPNGPEAFAGVRLNPDGSLDQTFGHGGIALAPIGVASVATGVAIERSGEIALGGAAQNSQGKNQFAAALFKPDGILDTGFGRRGTAIIGPTANCWGLVAQPNGKLVLVGVAPYADSAALEAKQFIAERLTATGGLDPSFGQGGIVKVPVGISALGFGVAAERDGTILLTGPAFTSAVVAAAVRLNADGSLDQSFGNGGIATFVDGYGVNGVVLDDQDRIVLPTTGAAAVRLNPDGSPDVTFGTGGNALAEVGTGGAANGAAIDPTTGDVVLAGAAIINSRTVLTVSRLLGEASAPPPSQPPNSSPPGLPTGTAPAASARTTTARQIASAARDHRSRHHHARHHHGRRHREGRRDASRRAGHRRHRR